MSTPSAPSPVKLRVGYVPGNYVCAPLPSAQLTRAPEHFSTPLHFAQGHGFFSARSLAVDLHAFPSGTGAMAAALAAGELDLAVGLTEGWVAALANGADAFKLVGKYVQTPLCWAISTGAARGAVALAPGSRLGVSRVGSGSYVMGFVLAAQQGWLAPEPFDWVVLDTFQGLRDAVNGVHADGKSADAFMWEHFTSKCVRRVPAGP